MSNLDLFGFNNISVENKIISGVVHYSINIGIDGIITTMCDRYINKRYLSKYSTHKSKVTCKHCLKRKNFKNI